MPASIHRLREVPATADIHIPLDDQDIHISYYPARITTKMLQTFEEPGQSMGTSMAFYAKVLPHIIQSWDLYKDEDQEHIVPLDEQHLLEIPALVLEAIFFEMLNKLG